MLKIKNQFPFKIYYRPWKENQYLQFFTSSSDIPYVMSTENHEFNHQFNRLSLCW